MATEQKGLNTIPFLLITIAVLGRILPHPANFSPFTSVAIISGLTLGRGASSATVLMALFISDLILAALSGYSPFGSWSIFTYSGFITVAVITNIIRPSFTYRKGGFLVVSASLLYWLWSNMGVWLYSAMYTKELTGLIECYIAALPFLQASLLGDLFYYGVTTSCLYFFSGGTVRNNAYHKHAY